MREGFGELNRWVKLELFCQSLFVFFCQPLPKSGI